MRRANPHYYQGFGKPTRRQQLQRRLLSRAKAGCEESARYLMDYWSLRVMSEEELESVRLATH
ncbi:hypothetical protein LCGC14_1893870 [marine sediment metagenome]|uniref:Uncharacterized protein n=1 Tax=marine sediment metagenome TaxID=412755 RepID=A0A0F9IWQ4_9ZZZZ